MRVTVVRGIGEVPLPEGRYWAAVNDPEIGTHVATTWETGQEDVILNPFQDDAADLATDGMLGDLNRNDRIDTNDLLTLYIRAISPERYRYDRLGNIDGDYGIDWKDVALLGRYVYGDADARAALADEYGIGYADQVSLVEHGFQIDLVWTTDLTTQQRAIIQRAAHRWEEVIWEDLPDTDTYVNRPKTFDAESWDWVNEHSITPVIMFDREVDDVVVLVGRLDPEKQDRLYATGGPTGLRNHTNLPILSGIGFAEDVIEDDDLLYQIALHELGHALGIAAGVWERKNLLSADHQHYTGWLARNAFRAAGGSPADEVPALIPIADPGHWRESVFGDEIMSLQSRRSDHGPVSAITVQCLADMGYGVNVGAADPYVIPVAAAKPLVHDGRGCQVIYPEEML